MSEILSGHSPKASDIFIAVMGMTGSGKSTFISLCTGQDVPVGHNLQACTQQVTVYKCQWSTNADVYLFDTPGFDDTNRSDTEVLIEIAACLAKTYEDNFRLSGILYLHRITDRRIGGSAKRNLFMFRKLCGKDGLNNVLLVTTMWEDEQPEKGHSREAELIATNGFWGALVEEGAEVKRHDNTRASAMTLLKVVAKKNRVAISIQKEMVSERKNLNETEAGMGLNSEILLAEKRVKKEMELALEMEREARRLHDEKSAEEQRQYRKKMQQKFDHLNQEREKLKVSLKEIKEQRFMYKELEAKYEKSQELMLQQAERIGTLEGQHQQRDKDIILRDQQTSRELEILRRKFDPRENGRLNYPSMQPRSSEPYYVHQNVTLCLAGRYYFFGGRQMWFCGKFPSGLEEARKPTDRGRYFALGTNGSWYYHYSRRSGDWTEWSGSLATQYPKLVKWLRSRDYGCPRHISLGADGFFYISMMNGDSYWRIPSVIADAIEKRTGQRSIDSISRLWLGYQNDFVVEVKEHDYIIDVTYYGGLSERLEKCKTIKQLAMNVEDPQGYVLIDGDGSTSRHEGSLEHNQFDGNRFDEFIDRNAGGL